MGERLTLSDWKILAELLGNSRQPLNAIARKVRISKQMVAYRMDRMAKRGDIDAFIAVVDYSRIGYTKFYLNLNVAPMSKEQEEEAFREILALGVVVLFKCEVEWNLLVGILAKNVRDAAEKNARIRQILKDKLTNASYSIYLGATICYPAVVSRRQDQSKIIASIGNATKPEQLDEKDELVLGAVSTNSRASYVELSKMTGLPPETVRYRLKLLEKRKIIASYTISLNPNLEGLHYYRVYISLNNPTEENVKKVSLFLLNLRQIRRVIRVVSNYDIVYDILVSSGDELRQVKKEVEQKFYSIINAQISIRLFQDARFCYFPPLPMPQKRKQST